MKKEQNRGNCHSSWHFHLVENIGPISDAANDGLIRTYLSEEGLNDTIFRF